MCTLLLELVRARRVPASPIHPCTHEEEHVRASELRDDLVETVKLMTLWASYIHATFTHLNSGSRAPRNRKADRYRLSFGFT
jgi:hypothetical protein